ncbi:MAG TPA: glycoside hydrolase family 15 protein [Marmoricola sp.]|jgi:GH15 family glucan-1,4-alpha-glucosidase|nr:glycoside hydrolase family 15 protein [Marmoricola sp.]
MALRLEDYALLGDTYTTALVGYDGSIDWLCLPRFDSDACFAALLGDPGNGRWLLAPRSGRAVSRRYRGDSLVLETDFATDEGMVRVVDAMPIRNDAHPVLVRQVQGLQGRVEMETELRIRYGYGHVTPLIRADGRTFRAIAGPDAITVHGEVDWDLDDATGRARFAVDEGDSVSFQLSWAGPRQDEAKLQEPHKALGKTERWWQRWADQCTYEGDYRDAVVRSLVTLKALSYAPSGGIVAAATTSLPEKLGGARNWDYRYCWLRDATFTLMALVENGYEQEAVAWREWLLRALAGDPRQMQIMYGVDGERRLPEFELDWLSGYADSRPIHVGNAAAGQYQLDVYGELMDALHQARVHGIAPDEQAWEVQRVLMDFLEGNWHAPDNGIWEMRGPRRDFTHSKVMAWAAVDRAIKGVEEFELDGPLDRWKQMRQDIHDEVCDQGYDGRRRSFTQYYGSKNLDAALLFIPQVGFLPADDPRMKGTVRAIERELCDGGFVQRYSMDASSESVDGLPPGEGAFLPCTFWLADNYILQGRVDEGREVFERLLGLRNDLGLLTEEYDAQANRLVGNFPQAFSHVPLVNTALNLADPHGPIHRRSEEGRKPHGTATKSSSRKKSDRRSPRKGTKK